MASDILLFFDSSAVSYTVAHTHFNFSPSAQYAEEYKLVWAAIRKLCLLFFLSLTY